MRFPKHLILIVFAAALLTAVSAYNISNASYKDHEDTHGKSQKIACPAIDITNISIKQPDCGESNGSITGVQVTSTGSKIFYTWYNASKKVVGRALNLSNIPEGVYTLEVTDNSGCTVTTISSPIVVTSKNAVVIEDSKINITNTSCKDDGSITGLTVTNAAQYDWRSTATGSVISTSTTTPDLLNIPAGSYQLTAYNSTCHAVSKIYNVDPSFAAPHVVNSKVTQTICGQGGSISVDLNVDVGSPILNWILKDESGTIVKNGVIYTDIPFRTVGASGVDAGIYSLYATNNDRSCSVLLGTFDMGSGELEISKDQTRIKNDQCNQHQGYVEPVISNAPPGSKLWEFTWTDISTGQVVAKTKTLTRVGAGVYRFHATYGKECAVTDTFTVTNVSPALVPPEAKGTTICAPGMINITVTNPDTSKMFRLYDSPTSTTPIDSSKIGVFYRNVDQTTDYYVTRVSHECESDRTKVTETVVFSVKIPNAFTPNGDGINDYWNLEGIDKFPGADIKIFTRYGKLIYHSINYPVPYNGTYNGLPVPSGVYYYIIDVKQPICFGKISGSLTIIR